MSDNRLLIAKGASEQYLLPPMANRHGLITGATGTGKTVTLQVIAESFSSIGVPVFLSDIKGDLSGLCEAGEDKPKMQERIQKLGLENFSFQGYPVQFWDVFGEQGLPVRTTISEMGPLLLSRLLNLNEVQSGVLNLVFRIADDMGLLLLDIKDLKSMLAYVAENAQEYTVEYGTVSKQSIGAIQRSLLVIEEQGGDIFFGEPAMDIRDLIQTDAHGLGTINILASDKLFLAPALYSTFLLWLLSELFEELPEVGDLEKPKMAFFFDEAHLLFDDAPKILLDKIEQVVRLIRSKGVGVYFITQNPIDIPDSILGQLGNRVQHALRGYTPKDQKAIRAAAETFRQNPDFSVEQVITELGVGEALVSFLDEKGRPSVVEKAIILPPHSLIGPVSQQKREKEYAKSPLRDKYEEAVDRDSAYEHLHKRAEQEAKLAKELEQDEEEARQEAKKARSTSSRTNSRRRTTSGRRPASMIEKMAKSAADTLGRQVGRELVRGILGSILRGGK
ncbi:helicase HerA-like domain-containing protein [Desulfitobacterium sp. THU1]|uniref:helicase HerA-like domain-containing protein n=1 Tax=Desulfitobacterium sp. THU1 TaxID=3138072 RepID=UPI00311E1F74